MAHRGRCPDPRLISLFLDMLAAERGAAANTLAAYARDLTDAADVLQRSGTSLAAATTVDLRHYLGQLQTRAIKPTTLARRMSALRQFYRFLCAENLRKDDPAAILRGPRRGRPLPKVLSVSEVEGLLAAARAGLDAKDAPAAERLRAARLTCLIEVLYATGLRVSELVALPATAARTQNPMLTVRGKGGKERLVPLNEAARQAMNTYLGLLRQSGHVASPWLFPSFGDSGHLTRQHFARDLKGLARLAGIAPKRVSPHVLRHAFASHLLHNGADLRIVQTLLGHADIATTQIYTHVLDDRLRAMVRDLHPLADG
jgi:integrase/recombinase XerD